MALKDDVWQALRKVPYPGYSRDVVSFGLVQRVAACDGAVTVSLAIGRLSPETRDVIARDVQAAVRALPGVQQVRIEIGESARMSHAHAAPAASGARDRIKHVIAVGSGKGGVGKSTVAVNIAVALARDGLRIGLMDTDVYGPNVPRMLGIAEPPPARDRKLVPAQAHGVLAVSVGLLVKPDTPVIWRGPMTDKLVRQFLDDVLWPELDMLVVDLPPGTGDVAMGVAQHLRPDGAVIVLTPQGVAVDDARRAAAMFERLEVPILGLVENMSAFVCGTCGTRHALFAEGGGRLLAEELSLRLLAEVPFEPAVCGGGDGGDPAVLRSGSPTGEALRSVAERVWQTLTRNRVPISTQ